MGCGASNMKPNGLVLVGSTRSMVLVTRSMMAYMPAAISQFYKNRLKEPEMPLLETFHAAVLFGDVSGFSFLLEQLSQHRDTAGGPERLTYLMNGFLGELVDAIVTHGGDIVQFAGDAFMAVWRTTKSALPDAAMKVLQVAKDVQHLISLAKVNDGAQAIALSMRIEIGAGEVTSLHFGNSERLGYAVVGREIDNVYIGDKLNEPGKIVLTKAAYELMKPTIVKAERIQNKDYYRFISLTKEVRMDLATPTDDSLPDEDMISPYIPNHVMELIRARQIDWLAEVRNVTMVFALLPKFDYAITDKHYGSLMQESFNDVLDSIAKYDGMLAHLSSDDKGIFCVIVLGIPSHENDALRGVSVAVEISKRFSSRNTTAQVGVSTGVAVSCSVGSRRRCQYTLYGGTVNLAARLMVACAKCKVPILCDEATSHEAKSRFFFRPLEALELKGFGKVTPYTPETQTNWNQKTTGPGWHATNVETKIKTIGRKDEIDFFLDAGQIMVESKKSTCILIEAEIGQGRATLISKLSNFARECGFKVYFGEADSIEVAPFNAFKNILLGIFRISASESAEDRREKVANAIPEQYLPYLALLNIILPMNFPDSENSFLLKGPARIEMLKKMIMGLLQKAVLYRPTLIILQDVQWLDSASWDALITAVHTVHPLMVVVGSRSISTPRPATYEKLLSLGAKHFVLGPLSDAENMEVIADRLGYKGTPPKNLVDYVKEVTAGNLLFMIELLARMRQEEGVLGVQNGQLVFNGYKSAGERDANKLSRNMQLLLTSKVDSLEPDAQLLIRVCSVIGRLFKWDAAVGIFPVTTRKANLLEDLKSLEDAELVSAQFDKESALENKTYFQFKSAMIQQIVYNSMVSKQRESLHLSAAEWFSQEAASKPNGDAGAFHANILYHYDNANMPKETFSYALKAAEYSLSISALEEAITYFQKAVDSPVMKELPVLKQAKILIQLSDAMLGCGKVIDAAKGVQSALVVLGCPDPLELADSCGEKLLIEKFQEVDSMRVEIVRDDDLAEREKLLEICNLYSRCLLCYGFIMTKGLSKICLSTCVEMKKILRRTGYSNSFAGIIFACSIALNMVGDLAESERYFALGKKILLNPQYQDKDFAAQLQPTLLQLKARTHVYTLLALLARGEFDLVTNFWDSSRAMLKAANDNRGLLLNASNYAGVLIFQGKFAEAQSVCADHTKIAEEVGDTMQYGLIFPMTEAYAMLRMGNSQDAHQKLLAVESVVRGSTIPVEQRINVYAASIRGLCYLQKREYPLALQSITPIETIMFELETSTPLYMIPYMAFMDVICELALEPRYKDNKQALALWIKMQPRFEAQGLKFLVGKGNILLRKAQLAKLLSENEGEIGEEVNKRFNLDLEDALKEINHIDVLYDRGVLHAILAKNYERNDPKALEHFTKGQAIFQRIGAMRHYIDLKQYWEGPSTPAKRANRALHKNLSQTSIASFSSQTSITSSGSANSIAIGIVPVHPLRTPSN